jgi:hypothetical protein
MRENDIDFAPDELGCELGEAFAASLRPAIFNRDGMSFDPTELAQSLYKSYGQLALQCSGCRAQESDGGQLPRLLRAGGDWPRSSYSTAA